VYRPSGNWVLSANGATAFRAPNVDDVGKVFDSEPGAVTVPNPNLAPEYAWSGDVGIAKVFGRKLKIDLTAYYTSLQNAMVRRNFQLNGQDSIDYDGTLSQVQAIQNAAIATVYGIQAGLEVKILPGLSFSTDLNFQKGREEQLSAMYSGQKSFEELPQEERAKTEIYAVDANGNPYSPGWYTLNFHTQYRMSDHFSLSGGIENITDQRYRTFSSGIAGPGRNFILSLRAHF
jgi:hemoglobin/transferrin/lactoferrin receptor protein